MKLNQQKKIRLTLLKLSCLDLSIYTLIQNLISKEMSILEADSHTVSNGVRLILKENM